jgi:GNAT superfamily N-acetyltransferase
MKFRALETFEDAEIVREIRNEARQWMGSQEFLDRADQLRWFDRISQLSPRDFYCYLAGDPPCGYGTVERRSDGRLWITLAVRETERGRGTGTRIYADLARLTSEPIYAGIRSSNEASVRAAEKACYRRVTGIGPPDISGDEAAQWIVLSSPP